MSRRLLLAVPAATLLLAIFAPMSAAHDLTTVTVEPTTVTAGDKVTIGVAGVEANQQRVIVLIGQGIVVQFPTVQTDSKGAFSTEVTLPARLPGGTYRFEVIGDETLTGDVTVMAAAGGIAAQPAPDQTAPASRSRPAAETALIFAAGVLAFVAGGVLVLGAERFKGPAPHV